MAEPTEVERWNRVKAIFVEVVEQERTAREAALRGFAERDPEAAAEARSLLRRFEDASTRFFAGAPEDGEGAPPPDLSGRVIGGYRLEAALGRGGMGTVYRAVREEDGKRVAVKLLHRRGDPREVAAQVRAERRILAALEHDHIARLIDGGATEEGLPFFTLEFVDGAPIVEDCERRGLDLEARLRLFRMVCAAVDYAHRRLVVHCDIKPANILVTAEGVPKLLDFGIARLLLPGEQTTTHGLTPDYAAPEQARAEAVTTATDVYALGLLLFELLTGRRAQNVPSLAPSEIRRVVCEEAAPRPSEAAADGAMPWRGRLRGDLDAIVAKALRKTPAERYGSAGELAEDVRRHQLSLPVEARAGGAVYRAGRFVRRHRAALAAAALVALSLVGGTVAATREAQKAQRRFEDVRRLAGSFLFEFHEAIRELPGATPARQLVVTKALEYLDGLAAEAEDDLELQSELSTAYQRVGDVQGYTANANLGDTRGAVASYRKAWALAEALVAAAPAETRYRLNLATALERLGTTLKTLGESAESRQVLERAQGLLEPLRRELPRSGEVAHALHVVILRQGLLSQAQGDADAALAAYHGSRQVDEDFLKLVPDDAKARRDLSIALSLIAQIEAARDPQKGLELYQALLPPAEALAAANPTNAELQRDLLVGHEDVAQMHGELGHWAESLHHHHQALAIAETLRKADPANIQAVQDLSIRHAQIGDVLLAKGDLPEALASYRRSLELDGEVAAREPANAQAAEYLGWSHLNVAGVLAKQGRRAEAQDHFRRAIAGVSPFAERDSANASLQELLGEARAGLAAQGK